MEHVFKLTEFNVINNRYNDEEDDYIGPKKDNSKFMIQMFAINEHGHKASIMVEDYPPFFYLKVAPHWGQTKKNALLTHLKATVGKYYENSIIECKLIERNKLYGYDAKKKHRFIEIKFANIGIYNKVKKQLLDICKSVPSLTIFLLPGGSLLLPLLIKFIPQILPSAFNENLED